MNYRSKLEAAVSNKLDGKGVPYLYEDTKLDYTLVSRYVTDFELQNGVFLEVKGFFKPSDRRKMLAVKQQHPELDIRMVFQRDQKLSKNSKMTYGGWCDKHGFQWCVFPNIPDDWFL